MRAADWTEQGGKQFERYRRTGDLDALVEAVRLYHAALDAVPDGHPNLRLCLSNLYVAASALAEEIPDEGILRKAAGIGASLLAVVGDRDTGYAATADDVAQTVRSLFEFTGDVAMLRAAAQLAQAAVAATAERDPDRAVHLANCGSVLRQLYEHTGDAEALHSALAAGRDAVAAMSAEHPNRAACLSSLGDTLRVVFDHIGDLAALEEAVELGRAAVTASGDDDPERVVALAALGSALQVLWEHTGDCAALEEAVTVGRAATAAAPAGHPHHEVVLANLGVSLRELFEHSGNTDLLHEAVAAHRQVIDATPDGHPSVAGRLTNLGNTLRALYETNGDPDALREAALISRVVLAAVPEDHPARVANLSNHAVMLVAQFDRTGDPDLLYDAVAANTTVLATLPAGHPSLAKYLSNLDISVRLLLRQTSATFDTRELLLQTRTALAAIADSSADSRGHVLSDLADVLRERYHRTGVVDDLDAAADANEMALDAVRPGDPARPTILSNLGITLASRFRHTLDHEDLDRAVDAGTQAAAEGDGHPERALILANLCDALRQRFDWRKSRADLDEAIRVGKRAVAAGPNEAVPWTNLGVSLRRMYDQTGELKVLDDTINAYRKALASMAIDDPERWVVLSGLATSLRVRFEHTGELADVDAAMDASQDAIAVSPEAGTWRAEAYGALANVAQTRFTRSQANADLETAVAAGATAVSATDDSHPERARYLSNLATALMVRYRLSGATADLDAAIAMTKHAVAIADEHYDASAMYLSNLAIMSKERYKQTARLEDLDEAVQTIQRAVDSTPDGHFTQAGMLRNLANVLHGRYQHTGNPADLDAAMDVGRAGAGMSSGSPLHRIMAAWAWANAATTGERWHDAVDAYTAVIRLLDLVSPRALGRVDQEDALARLPEFGSLATACCVQAGMLERAVELFEQGRGVLFRYALDSWIDLTELRDADAGLASQFAELRDELDRVAATPEDEGAPFAAGLGGRRIELTTAFDELVKEIQTRPGFENFLAPPSIDAVRTTAAHGPVVLINVADQRSDALIVTADGVLEPLPLPGLTPAVLREQTMALFHATAGWSDADVEPGPAAEDTLTGVLEWLWDEVTGPVLDRLRITGPPQAGPDGQPAWPRVWWCPSGMLSFLPLHASGHHDRAETVMDRVVSSYTPSLRALAHARRPRPPASTGRLVAVAMRRTPGLDSGYDLPSAEAEIDMLRDLFPHDLDIFLDDAARRREVLAALPTARWAHFACHARADIRAPSESRLVLSDWDSAPLTVADVARLRLDTAELAFLSACSTARGGLLLSDEAIHLGSAFQLAGFRHVIATLWPVEDSTAAAVARGSYRSLHADNDAAQAALALHDAAHALRRRAPTQPTRWAAHVHIGA